MAFATTSVVNASVSANVTASLKMSSTSSVDVTKSTIVTSYVAWASPLTFVNVISLIVQTPVERALEQAEETWIGVKEKMGYTLNMIYLHV